MLSPPPDYPLETSWYYLCGFFWADVEGRARAFDGKAKVWSVEQRICVATHTETDRTLWALRWLPKTGRSEYFVTAGAGRNVAVYREATGG